MSVVYGNLDDISFMNDKTHHIKCGSNCNRNRNCNRGYPPPLSCCSRPRLIFLLSGWPSITAAVPAILAFCCHCHHHCALPFTPASAPASSAAQQRRGTPARLPLWTAGETVRASGLNHEAAACIYRPHFHPCCQAHCPSLHTVPSRETSTSDTHSHTKSLLSSPLHDQALHHRRNCCCCSCPRPCIVAAAAAARPAAAPGESGGAECAATCQLVFPWWPTSQWPGRQLLPCPPPISTHQTKGEHPPMKSMAQM